MRVIYPWVYSDYKNNIWKFSLNSNKDLSYGIMYKEGKWTKETLIDTKVLGFALYIDENETMHLVYSNTKGELRYCTMKDKQWVGKVLYQLESRDFEIENLKIEIVGSAMHIFYLLVDNDGSDHGLLMHCMWNGEKTIINTLQDIILRPNLKEYYFVNINYKNDIYVFFLSDEGDEISLNYFSFENNTWLPVKRLYGIQGEDIGFEVVINRQEIHIINKSKDNSIYSLHHVLIDSIGNIKDFKIHESEKRLEAPLVFIETSKLCSCWLEDNKIFYSIFKEDKWESPIEFDKGNDFKLERYNSFICIDNDGYIKEKKIYGTNGLDLYLYDPSDFLINIKDSLRYNKKTKDESYYEDDLIGKLKTELARVKSDNKSLENKISYLNIRMQKNQKFVEEYEEQISRVLDQKRKAEENCNVFLELQKKMQKEFEAINIRMIEEKAAKEKIENKMKLYKEQNYEFIKEIEMIKEEKNKLFLELENLNKNFLKEKSKLNMEISLRNSELIEEKATKLKLEEILEESSKENSNLKEEIIRINEEKVKLALELSMKNKELLEEQKAKLDIENKLKDYKDKNNEIKKEVELINEENKRLEAELELEKNQSVMERLLRRRTSSGQNF